MQRREDKHEIIMLDSGLPSRELLLGPVRPQMNPVFRTASISWEIDGGIVRCWHKNYSSTMGNEGS